MERAHPDQRRIPWLDDHLLSPGKNTRSLNSCLGTYNSEGTDILPSKHPQELSLSGLAGSGLSRCEICSLASQEQLQPIGLAGAGEKCEKTGLPP